MREKVVGFWGGVFLHWKKKEHLKYLLATRIAFTPENDTTYGHKINTRVQQSKPQSYRNLGLIF